VVLVNEMDVRVFFIGMGYGQGVVGILRNSALGIQGDFGDGDAIIASYPNIAFIVLKNFLDVAIVGEIDLCENLLRDIVYKKSIIFGAYPYPFIAIDMNGPDFLMREIVPTVLIL
jgi:hypothetical protein